MDRKSKRLVVDYPNIRVLPALRPGLRYGQFVTTDTSDQCSQEPVFKSVASRDMYLPNYSIRVLEGSVASEMVFVNREGAGLDLMGSCFFFKGNVNTVLPNQSEGIVSRSRTHNFKYDPNNEFTHIMPANHPFHFVHVSMNRSAFERLLPDGEGWADVMRERIAKRERIVGDQFSPISILQERALNNIFDCPLEGKLGYAMIETSVTQLILLQLYALFNTKKCARASELHRRDVDTIHMVKEHLKDTFLHDHSVEQLAMHFGMNTNKLMSVFKRVFGQTIFEHITQLRMDHALVLLRERGATVREVAHAIGYKNANHFSTAFKKRFEACPSDYAQ